MYEVTVSTPCNQKYLLDYVQKSLSPYLCQIKGVEANLQDKWRNYYTLACGDTFKAQLKRNVTDCVSKVLSLGCKNLFVRDLLKLNKANFYQNLLVNTICVFDNAYDKQLIAHLVDTDSNVFIDGYYNFRLGDFKRRWKEVINMVVENDYILHDNQLILDFLKYLLETTEQKVKNLSICLEKNDFYLYDSSNRLFPKNLSLAPQFDVFDEAIVNALCLNPQKVKVYHSCDLPKDFCNASTFLFDTQFVRVN